MLSERRETVSIWEVEPGAAWVKPGILYARPYETCTLYAPMK